MITTETINICYTPGKARIVLILTRSLNEGSNFGRVKTLRAICEALNTYFDVTVIRLHNVLETRRISEFVALATRWLLDLLVGRPIPLQTILYSGANEIKRLTQNVSLGAFDAVYVDSVRCQLLLRQLRKHLPGVRMVVDFDDLMSRRMEQMAQKGIPLSLGFLQHLFPKTLRWLVEGPLSALIARYEANALRLAEAEMVNLAQAVVLVSSKERDLLQQRLAGAIRTIVHAVPPPASVGGEPMEAAAQYRFIFIGSDQLAQNRLSIDFLLALWRKLTPPTCLHIYGRQKRTLEPLQNVQWHGFVDDISEVYENGSILLLPAILAGGIKTKVIEAWSFGCPVLGNSLAFEGLEISRYPLVQSEDKWAQYILNPNKYSAAWTSAAHIGNTFVRTVLTSERFDAYWRNLMLPGANERN